MTAVLAIGVTGGIGSGKSALVACLERRGLPVLRLDDLAKELYLHDDIREQVRAVFGSAVFGDDGRVDHRLLATAVFSDPERLARLNAIIHPPVFERLRTFLEEQRRLGRPAAVVEAALIIETGLHALLDRVVLVTADEDLRIARVIDRDRSDTTSVRLRIANQMQDEQRLPFVHHVVANDGTLADLERATGRLLGALGLGQATDSP